MKAGVKSSEAVATCGFIFGVLFMVIIVVAGKIHWGDEAPICLVPAVYPFQVQSYRGQS